VIQIEDIIELPENPEGSGFTDDQWKEIMVSIWVQWWKIYCRQNRDRIDESLQDFTDKVFAHLGKYVEELEKSSPEGMQPSVAEKD
jgi:hypothetical protein